VSYPPPPYGQQPPQYGAQPYPPVQPYGAPPPGYTAPPPPPKKPDKTLRAVLVGIACLLVFCVGAAVIAGISSNSAPDSDPVAAAPRTGAAEPKAPRAKITKAPAGQAEDADQFDLKLGATAKFSDRDGAQSVTVKSVKSFKDGCSRFAPEPDNGLYVVVDVVVSVTEGSASINPLYFEWVGNDGTTANAISGAFSGCDKNNLTSANGVRAGRKRAGQIVYDVPSAKGSIEFSPDAFGSAEASWKA
jgi:hypothetical protein